MRMHLQRLGTDTAIYGVGTIVGRFLNFLLVPFYTNILLPADLGIVSYMFSMIAFANVIYAYGMESAYFRYSTSLEIGTQKQNFSVPFFSLLSTSVMFSFMILILQHPLASMLSLPRDYTPVVAYAAGIMALDAIAIIPFAVLRMERKAKTFAFIKIVSIVVNVVLNIVFLVVLRTGVVGIFISGLIASAVTIMFLLPTIVRSISWKIDGSLLTALLKFALPYVPAGLATQAIQVIDRPIMRALTDDATVGIYQANYRLGIFMMLVVQMFDFAWRPFYFSTAKEPNAKQIFARVLTYFVFIMAIVFLVLTLFIQDVVKIHLFGHHLIHQSYWSGLNIVPLVLLGYLFLGISNNLSAGVYIEKKTRYLPMITFIGAGVNIAANYLLIPSIGILGGAWATMLAYLVMAIVLNVVAQRIYPVTYEVERLFKIGCGIAVAILVYAFIPTEAMSDWMVYTVKAGCVAVFLVLMYVLKFFEKRELEIVKQLFTKPPATVPPSGEEQKTMDM